MSFSLFFCLFFIFCFWVVCFFSCGMAFLFFGLKSLMFPIMFWRALMEQYFMNVFLLQISCAAQIMCGFLSAFLDNNVL